MHLLKALVSKNFPAEGFHSPCLLAEDWGGIPGSHLETSTRKYFLLLSDLSCLVLCFSVTTSTKESAAFWIAILCQNVAPEHRGHLQ